MAVERRAQLPTLDQLSEPEFKDVYEPSDDTWLLCDAILLDSIELFGRAPVLAVEIGPGSGAVCGFVELEFTKRGITSPFFI